MKRHRNGIVRAVKISTFLGLVFLLVCCLEDYSTPKEWFFVNTGEKNEYSIDSLMILDILNKMVDENTYAFHSSIYDHEAELRLHRILYSPKKEKIAALITVRTLLEKNEYLSKEDLTAEYNFYGTIFLFHKREGNQIELDQWFSLVNINSFENFDLSLRYLEEYSFKVLGGMKDQKGEHYYNLDDIRFWEHHIWD